MLKLAKKIYNIHRSITGNGVRKTLKVIQSHLPDLKIKSFKSGSKVFDWKIPPEWNINDAYIADLKGKKLIDFKNNNLHIVNYSTPVNKILNKENLLKHIHTIPQKPKSIPYITSYYKKYWGFCLKHEELKLLKDNKYKILISSKFNNYGKLNYGELFIKGSSKKEIIIHTYICHPKLANNESSGPTLVTYLAKFFAKRKNNYSIRFLFLPETIGAIAYLNNNYKKLKKNFIGGYVITCVGDERNYSFLQSKNNNSLSNIVAYKTFKKLNLNYKKYSFLKRGSDERQYNSPGIDMDVASIMRTKYGEYPEYHNSDDNFNVVTKRGLNGSFNLIKNIILNFNKEIVPKATNKCEPFLSKRNLYPPISTGKIDKFYSDILNFLTYSDGNRNLEEIGKIIALKNKELFKIYKKLKNLNLID